MTTGSSLMSAKTRSGSSTDRARASARLGLDSVYSCARDAHGRRVPTEKRGFLQLLMQITFSTDGAVSVTPLPPLPADVHQLPILQLTGFQCLQCLDEHQAAGCPCAAP
jgi:hypothetical protein